MDNKNTFDRGSIFKKYYSGNGEYLYNVALVFSGNSKISTCPFRTAEEVNDHLRTIRKYNKKKIVFIRVYKKGELIKEWRDLNFGTLDQ